MRPSRSVRPDSLAETWRTEGWLLVEGLIDVATIDAAVEEMWSIFAPPTVFHGGESDARVDEFFARRDRDLLDVEPWVGALDRG